MRPRPDELVLQFGLSEIQADAILQMQLRRLTALETDKIRLEHEDLLAKIADYKDILARRERVFGIITTELGAIRSRYSLPAAPRSSISKVAWKTST